LLGGRKTQIYFPIPALLLHFTALLHDCIAAQQSQTYESAMDGGLRSLRDTPMLYILTI